MNKIKAKEIREETGIEKIHTKDGIKIIEKNVGEIHLVLKNKSGQIKEDRLTTDKQRRKDEHLGLSNG